MCVLYLCVRVRTRTRVCDCMGACMYAWMHASTRVCMHSRLFACVHGVHAWVHTCVCCVYVCVCEVHHVLFALCICVHTCVCVFGCMCACLLVLASAQQALLVQLILHV